MNQQTPLSLYNQEVEAADYQFLKQIVLAQWSFVSGKQQSKHLYQYIAIQLTALKRRGGYSVQL